ncbi:hypothetical protein KS4_22670 [Poriferisphaera corsica]|uniref:Uncharacterized protein n=1 Tax=Poriferisphaera corsica TaxID=2528020 RepID=A0A517YVK2_9BACT|nr:hypothetical protein KS4_22670 [Poriferisphaera corsica]
MRRRLRIAASMGQGEGAQAVHNLIIGGLALMANPAGTRGRNPSVIKIIYQMCQLRRIGGLPHIGLGPFMCLKGICGHA